MREGAAYRPRMLFAHALLALAAAQETPPAVDSEPRGLKLREKEACDGYTLFAPIRAGTTFLLDLDGQVVHAWKHGVPTLGNYLLDNGHLVFLSRLDDNPVFFGGGIGGCVRELDWDGKLVWEWVLSTETRITHHDLEPMPNGHFLAIAWEHLLPDEAIARGRDPAATSEHGWWPDVIMEIEPTRPSGAKIVWEWRMRDHLIQDFDREKPNYGSPADRPERFDVNFDHRDRAPMSPEELRKQRELEKQMRELGYAGGDDAAPESDGDPKADAKRDGDWAHTNSVDYNPALDLILLSSPQMCEAWIIDHSTTTEEARGSSGGRYKKGGDVLWRWGNPRNYGCGTDGDKQLFYQHQPDWIRDGCPGAGHVLVFNNGSKRPGDLDYSSVDELVLPLDPKLGFAREPGAAFGPSTPVWSYSAPKRDEFFSFFISGAQRLPNGNTFICSGQQGRLFEVTSDQRIVWEFLNPWGGELASSSGNADPQKDSGRPSPVQPTSVFRATRIVPTHPALAGRKLEPIDWK